MTRYDLINELESDIRAAERIGSEYVSSDIDVLKMAVEALKTATWIPVTDGLPEEPHKEGNMQIVIDIDESLVNGIKETDFDSARMIVCCFQATIAEVIRNGTPLPEGHGRMIDVSTIRIKPEYMHNVCGMAVIRVEDLVRVLGDAPTIIEADKEVKQK